MRGQVITNVRFARHPHCSGNQAATCGLSARSGGRTVGPAARTWRVRGHVSVDKQGYRDPDDVSRAVESDPLRRAKARLLEAGTRSSVMDAIDAEVAAEVAAAVAFAHASPLPAPEEAFEHVQTFGAGTWR